MQYEFDENMSDEDKVKLLEIFYALADHISAGDVPLESLSNGTQLIEALGYAAHEMAMAFVFLWNRASNSPDNVKFFTGLTSPKTKDVGRQKMLIGNIRKFLYFFHPLQLDHVRLVFSNKKPRNSLISMQEINEKEAALEKENQRKQQMQIAYLKEQELKAQKEQEQQNIIYFLESNVAIAHIICGEVYRLDPVIGDAACEMRPPFVLDMADIIFHYIQNKGYEIEIIKIDARQYCNDVLKYGETIYDINQIEDIYNNTTANCLNFVKICDEIRNLIKDENYIYLGLCKALTRNRKMIYDRYGISLGDEKKKQTTFSKYKKLLGSHSVRYMRFIANKNCQNLIGNSFLSTQLQSELINCNAIFSTDNDTVETLPIYSAMRSILSYELNQGRPMVIVLNRLTMKNKTVPVSLSHIPNTDNVELEPNTDIEITSFDSRVYFYSPDINQGRYVLKKDLTKSDVTCPCTVYECFSIYSEDAPTFNTNDVHQGLFSEDNEIFFNAFEECDITKMILLYAASHPPMSGRGSASIANTQYNFAIDGGHSYIKVIQNNICNTLPIYNIPTLSSNEPININNDQEGNLSNEYDTYRNRSINCGMLYTGQNDELVMYHGPVKFITNTNNDLNLKYRYSKNIFFRISHILPSTFEVTMDRVNQVKVTLQGYQGGKLINYTQPSDDLDKANNDKKDSFYRDDN